MKKGSRVVVCVTGGIASYRSADLVGALRDKGSEVQVIMTEAATRFLGAVTLETLSGRPVVTDLFAPGSNVEPVHTRIANWADGVIIYPASAKVIGKIANGICDDALTCTVVATSAPVFIAPAMNDKMYGHPAVKRNVAALRDMGYRLIEPLVGELACGYTGIGHVASVEAVIKAISKVLRS
ncbi:MAG: hypothetical protein HYY14_06460 [Candidatus Omnitrophica bacterium]|nr:hypothetical protein [Candidatus Omnitrophota bacterium]